MKWLMLLLAGCDIGVPAVTKTNQFGVVTLVETASPCIDAIVFHYTFEAEDGRLYHASAGMDPKAELPRPWMSSRETETYYVADVSHDPMQLAARGPCAMQLESYAGEVIRVVPAASLDEAHEKLVAIEKNGWPAKAK